MESYTLEEKVASQGHAEYSDGTDCEQRGFRRKIYYVNDTGV